MIYQLKNNTYMQNILKENDYNKQYYIFHLIKDILLKLLSKL